MERAWIMEGLVCHVQLVRLSLKRPNHFAKEEVIGGVSKNFSRSDETSSQITAVTQQAGDQEAGMAPSRSLERQGRRETG